MSPKQILSADETTDRKEVSQDDMTNAGLRLACKAMVWGMPEAGVKEMLIELAEIYQHYREPKKGQQDVANDF